MSAPVTKFSYLAEIFIQKYERYLPTAFDESLSLLQKVNKIIKRLDDIGLLNNQLIDAFNSLITYVDGQMDGIDDKIYDQLGSILEDWFLSGKLGEMVNDTHITENHNGQNFVSKTLYKFNHKLPVKMVAYGDSITWGYTPTTGEQVSTPYPTRLQSKLIDLFHYPDITVVNAGTPGWQSDEGKANFQTKVLDEAPDVVFIMFGINDVRGHVTYGPALSVTDYKANYLDMILQAKAQNIEVVLLTPTPFLDVVNNTEMLDYVKAVKELGATFNVAVVDLQQEIMKLFMNHQENMIDFFPDLIHFSPSKYPIIADVIIGELLYSPNVMRLDKQEKIHVPIVRNPYIDYNTTRTFEHTSQFYKQNIILRGDAVDGTYVRCTFYNSVAGMDLFLKSAKNPLGGQIKVLFDGVVSNTIDCYSLDSYLFEAEDIILKNVPLGLHTVEFKYENILQGQVAVGSTPQIYLTELFFQPNKDDLTQKYTLLDGVTPPTYENFKGIIKGKSRLTNPNGNGAVGNVFFSSDRLDLYNGKTLVLEVEGKFVNRSGISWFGNHGDSADMTGNVSKLNLGYMLLLQSTGSFLYAMGQNNSPTTSFASATLTLDMNVTHKVRVEHTPSGDITIFIDDVQVMTANNKRAFTGWSGLYMFELGTMDISRYEYCYK